MKLKRYAKAIATAVGATVATVVGIYFGWDPEMITTQSVAITGAINIVVTTLFPLFGPANAPAKPTTG